MTDIALVRHQEETSKVTLGFWVYLMTDCVLFASLFATYAVLHGSTAGGPGGRDIFDLSFVFIETVILLTSSLAAGLAFLAFRIRRTRVALSLLTLTFLLGLAFVVMEVSEFNALVADGHSWQQSGFLSAYFTLVGTHGLHIIVGLIWIVSLLASLYAKGVTNTLQKRFSLFVLFWHFLDIIWIFIFSLVYLMGVVI